MHKFYVRNRQGLFLAHNRSQNRHALPVKWVRTMDDAEGFEWWSLADGFRYSLPPNCTQTTVIVESRGDIWSYDRAKLAGLLREPPPAEGQKVVNQ